MIDHPSYKNDMGSSNPQPTLVGWKAIEYAEQNGLNLNKYADPTEGVRLGLSHHEARVVAKEDPSLIWVEVQPKKDLPADYESCGECGFDHEYEPNEANRAHAGKPI